MPTSFSYFWLISSSYLIVHCSLPRSKDRHHPQEAFLTFFRNCRNLSRYCKILGSHCRNLRICSWLSEAITGSTSINIQRRESRQPHIFLFYLILSVPSCYIKNKHFRPYSTPQIRKVRIPTDFQNFDLSIGRSPTIFPV